MTELIEDHRRVEDLVEQALKLLNTMRGEDDMGKPRALLAKILKLHPEFVELCASTQAHLVDVGLAQHGGPMHPGEMMSLYAQFDAIEAAMQGAAP